MCGITGIVNFSSTDQDKKILRSMTDQIIYRGPDSSGYFQDKFVGLGMRRLSIIDLTTGDQPISNEDNTITVVFNGEIYNYLHLRQELIKKGHKFKTNSDTEVLVHLYEEMGMEMVYKLNGMFAFAVWDKNIEQLFVARDHVGVKPLYYYSKGSTLIFGSEPKTILKHPLVKRRIDQEALALYCYLGYVPGDLCIFDGLQKLLPGHFLVFNKSGLKVEKYFNLQDNQSQQKLDALFTSSINMQSIADVPLGVFLSGGLDSSLVTYYLKNVSKKINTFSISFEEKSFDEGEFAQSVAKYLGTSHHQDLFGVKDIFDILPKINKLLDEPLADPSLIPTYKVSKFTRSYVKVVLSGDGGDELFGGYPTYQGHLVADWVKLFGPLNMLAGNFAKLLPRRFENYSKEDIVTSFLFGVGKEPVLRHLFWMSIFSNGHNSSSLFKSAFKNNLKDISESAWINNLKGSLEPLRNKLTKMQALDFYTYLPDDLLVKVDRASMYNSLEVRVPILDPRIISYAFNSNTEHLNLGQTKIALRSLLKGRLPVDILGRRKKGFGIPVAKWINGPLSELVDSYLANDKLYEFFDKKAVENLLIQHRKRKANQGKIIWMLIILSGWLENWGD